MPTQDTLAGALNGPPTGLRSTRRSPLSRCQRVNLGPGDQRRLALAQAKIAEATGIRPSVPILLRAAVNAIFASAVEVAHEQARTARKPTSAPGGAGGHERQGYREMALRLWIASAARSVGEIA